jgi:hypothetical protein
MQFLNVDLEIRSAQSLQLLLDSLGDAVFVLHSDSTPDQSFASLELADNRDTNADRTITQFCDLIQALPDAARQLWDTANTKIFDVGYQLESTDKSWVMSELAAATLDRLAKVGGRLRMTVYFDRKLID